MIYVLAILVVLIGCGVAFSVFDTKHDVQPPSRGGSVDAPERDGPDAEQ
jgi:hypothetical protein